MCHLASDALGSLSKSHLASLSRRLSEGVRVHHPIRGNGIITGELARDGKPYGVKFDNGEGHAYSVASAAKRLTPIGQSVQDRLSGSNVQETDAAGGSQTATELCVCMQQVCCFKVDIETPALTI